MKRLLWLVVAVLCSTLTRGDGHGDSVDHSHARALRSLIDSVSPGPKVGGRTFSKEIKLEGNQDQVDWGQSGDAAIKRAFRQTIAQTLTDALPAQMTVAPGDISISKVTIPVLLLRHLGRFVTKVLLDV